MVESLEQLDPHVHGHLEPGVALELALFDAVMRAIRGEPVSDFEASFSQVREALDLRFMAGLRFKIGPVPGEETEGDAK